MNVEELPVELRQHAYWSGREAAWPESEAVLVVDYLAKQGIAVLGGEVWLPTEPGPTIPMPFVYAWDVGDKRSDESWTEFLQRARALAVDYIERFAWDEADSTHRALTPYFNFTLCQEQEYPALARPQELQ